MCLWKANRYLCGHDCGNPFLYDHGRCNIARSRPRLSDGAYQNCPKRYIDVQTADVIRSCCSKDCCVAKMVVELPKRGGTSITFEQARNILNNFKSDPKIYPPNSDVRRIIGYHKDRTDFKTAAAIESFDGLDLNRDSERQRGNDSSTGTSNNKQSSNANRLAPPAASKGPKTPRRSYARKKARSGGASRGGIGKAQP